MLRTTFPPFLTDDNLQLHEQDFREPRLVVLLRDRLSFGACPDVLISSAPCDSKSWERMGKTHISCQIYSGTQIILALQNKTQEPNLICLQAPREQDTSHCCPRAEDLLVPRGSGSSDKEAVQLSGAKARAEDSHLRGCLQAGGRILQSEKSVCVWKSPRMQNRSCLLLKASWLKWVCCYALSGPRLHSSRTHNSWYCQRGGQECRLRAL